MRGSIPTQSPNRLPPRDPRGGRPIQELATQLGAHILDVALEQFVAHGFEGTSMEKIAVAANVSKRTLYSRFGSKRALLVASIEQNFSRHLYPIKDSIPRGSLRKKIRHLAHRTLDASLKPEAVGIEALTTWLSKHMPGLMATNPTISVHVVIDLMQSVLESAPEWCDSGERNGADLARFLFDTLITVPRQRILVRREMPNTPTAKAEYLDRTLDLLARALPILRDPEDKQVCSAFDHG